MKKVIYTLLVLASVGIISTSCKVKKTPEEKIEDGVEEVGDGIEDAIN